MRWLPHSADAATLLTRQPPECLARPAEPEQAFLTEVGRAAFRDPLVLGGQAARSGLSCETCHQNGRRNANFDFPGLSGAPGTADVTSFLFSSHRGDHVDDPRPIPDLGGPKAALKISQAPQSRALEVFINGLITEEFDGQKPPAAVLDGLAAYVRALDPAACGASSSVVVSAAMTVDNARRAVRAAQGALDRGDAATTMVMIQAARAQLGVLAERYAGSALSRDRADLSLADLDLASSLEAARGGQRTAADDLAAWLMRSSTWADTLARDEALSLYDPAVLAEAANGWSRPVTSGPRE
jgi:hypothetical protein